MCVCVLCTESNQLLGSQVSKPTCKAKMQECQKPMQPTQLCSNGHRQRNTTLRPKPREARPEDECQLPKQFTCCLLSVLLLPFESSLACWRSLKGNLLHVTDFRAPSSWRTSHSMRNSVPDTSAPLRERAPRPKAPVVYQACRGSALRTGIGPREWVQVSH